MHIQFAFLLDSSSNPIDKMATPSTDISMTSLVDNFYKAHFVEDDEYITNDLMSSEDDEVGLMDYRFGDITAQEKDSHIIASIVFNFGSRDEYDDGVPDGFEDKWCAKFNAKEIAEEALGEEFNILDAFWDGNKLFMIIDNLENLYEAEDIINYLQDNSLEDGPFESCPGESFWVLSYKDLAEMKKTI